MTDSEIQRMKEILIERLRNVSSVTYDQAVRIADYLVDSGTVTYSTMFDMPYPPIQRTPNE